MEPLRPKMDASARVSSQGSRNLGAYGDSMMEGHATGPGQRTRNDFGFGRLPNQATIPQAKASSRIPQVFSHRRGSNEQSDRPPLTHRSQSHSQSWALMSGANPGRSITHPVVSPASGMLQPVSASPRPRQVLRRKQSSISQDTASTRNGSGNGSGNGSNRASSSCSDPRSQTSVETTMFEARYDRGLTESPMEIRIAQKVELPKTTAQTVTIYPELDRYRDIKPPTPSDAWENDGPYRIATHDLPPPTPLFSEISTFSGSPSTRFSESPGPGPYSRDTTPTSISSQSPGLVAPARLPATRVRQASGETQARAHITRRRAGSISNEGDALGADLYGLAVVRESLTSSSSNSTVRDAEKKDKAKRKKKRLSPLPPSPPPRKSSQKFHKSRDEEESPSKASRAPTQPVLRASPTVKATSSSHVRQPSLPTQPSHGVASKTVPPVRPSRDGTPDLQSQFELPVPIIHSNLSTSSLSERRYSQTVAPASLHRSVTPSSSQDRPQPPTQLPLGREPTPAPRRGASYDSQVSTKPEGGRTTRTPSPGISTFKTRFPLFGRRTKTNAEEPQQDNKQKPTRKGPAAGTGHEGYGRLGAARRRSSSAARGANGTLPSQESLNSGQFYDPFLADRMAPVVIAGGEIVENRNTSSELSRTDSNLSVPFSRPTDSRNNSQVSLSSREGARRTLWPSAFPRDSSQAPSIRSRRPSDSSDSEALAMKSTLAYRRSVQRMKATDQQMPRVPKPIVTRPEVVSPAVTSIDESIMSDDSMFMPRTGPATSHQELEGADSPRPKKLTKRARSPRRWNFFGRSQSQYTSAPKKTAMEESARTVAATVKAVQQKPVAFYTIMDSSEQEDADTPNIQEVVREARAFEAPVQTERERRPSITQNPSTVRRPSIPRAASRERGPSLTQPSPRGRQTATMANGTPKTQLLSQRRSVTSPAVVPQQQLVVAQSQSTEQAPPTRQGTGRPSRLPQVGRIPKVVSARPEQTSPKSFSRPFHRISVQLEQPKLGPQDADSLAKGPSPPKPSTPELTQDESTITGGTSASESRLSNFREFSPEAGRVSKEFLSFSPRKNSLATMATTCSSCSGAFPYADATAVVPAPNEPLAEDEIWDEYNDLLGDENLLKAPPSVGVSVARIFRRGNLHVQLAAPVEAPVEAPMEAPLESPTISLDPPMESLDGTLLVAKMPTTSSIYSADMTDKIKESLEVGPHPSSPFSVTKFVVGYGDRNNSVDLGGKTASSPEQTHRTPAEPTRRSDASGSSQGSEDNSPLSQVNLRVGSMTVSKWLTFGHVLFSPVREELNEIVEGSLKRQSVLVIDGLGNDDWSFYAAETYPAATFFNLSPRAPLPADHRSSSTFPLSPANHHQVQYPTLSGKFPFGQESFTSVVFRFPVAAPEGHYRNIISEARRVLKPGGFIELSILDVDLNNMGNHGRRAVRRLKERIHSKSSDVSLGSTSDLILRLLGRRGFVDIKTCRVGVPVATPVSRSSGSERSSTSGKIPTLETPKPKPKKEDRSLADMMSDESPVADENITKMVAKVGRWWYSRCYETAASAAPGATSKASLWNDRTLLAECQERGTSLKLMVCHARVPDGKGRLASI